MKKEEYIKMIAKNLADNRKRIDKLGEANFQNMSDSQISKNQANLNWECMNRSMNEERLRFALGDLKLEDCRDYYEPSAFHKYKGVGEELSKLKLS
jgi:hypothetical protein